MLHQLYSPLRLKSGGTGVTVIAEREFTRSRPRTRNRSPSGEGIRSLIVSHLAGMNCIVTGATSGIGRMTAHGLAAFNANLILVGRNERAGRDVARRLQRKSPGATIEFVRADLSRKSDIRTLADIIGARFPHVDILINNAGARFDTYHHTDDGIELTFATNHLGHFLLTGLLLERLVRAPAARVITVSSGSHSGATADGRWCLDRAGYDRRLAYAKSKLANIMFAYELGRRLQRTQVTSNAVDPGGVASNFGRNNGLLPWLRHLVAHALRRELASPRTAADAIVYLATSADLAGVTGKFFRRQHQAKSSSASYDRAQAEQLWALSTRLTDLDSHGSAANA